MRTAIVYDKDGSVFKVIDSLIHLRVGELVWFNRKTYRVTVTTFEIEEEVLNVIIADV